MRVRLLSVGKPRDAGMSGLHDRYAGRLRRLGVDYDTLAVAEVRAGGRYSVRHALEREAEALAGRWGDRPGTVVALDRQGDELDSEQLARRLARWARPALTLVIGGPHGLHAPLVRRADAAWSLSRLTFPHELVRVLVAEQLYRALTLIRGIPYHK